MKTRNLVAAGFILVGIFGANAQSITAVNAGPVVSSGIGQGTSVHVGTNSGTNSIGGTNVFVGLEAGRTNADGSNNVFSGAFAGRNNASGRDNVFTGTNAGYNNISNTNVFVGSNAGYSNISGRDNVFLGYSAGYLETGSNRLYIANSGTATPLIWGDFSSKNLTFNLNSTASSKLVINGFAGTSGLKLQSLTNATPASKYLTTNSSGDVILQNLPTTTVTNNIANGQLTTTVNGVVSAAVTLPASVSTNIYTNDGTLGSVRTVNMNDNDLTFNPLSANSQFVINGSTGKVGIGGVAEFPSTVGGVNVANYKLYVTGGILTDEVRVSLSSNGTWADYVFADDYNLKPLSEVESFIAKNKHLPNVPSAAQVKEEGINVADMARIQQEKIEELTLYLIQQNKEVEVLKAQVKALMERK